MAAPTVPTVNSILTEAFRRCGVPSPTVAQLTRAEDEWLEEVKQELHLEKRWHNHEETMVLIPQAYTQIYPVPSPLERILAMRFYSGITGTASAGGTATITLAAGGDILGRKIFLTGGTGVAQSNRIIGLSGLVATVSCDWTTVPDSTTTYMIANFEQVVRGPELGLQRLGIGATNVVTKWEQFENQMVIWPVPNASTYALEIQGTVDISLVDKTDARMTQVLREFRVALIAGLQVKIKEDQQDEDLPLYRQRYEQITLKLMKHDSRKHRGLTPTAMRGPGGLPRRRLA